MYSNYMSGAFDFTGTQMMLTIKLTSFAYNLYDGTVDRRSVFPAQPYEDARKEKMYSERRKYAVTKLPSPLEFFGYVYCFTCVLAGPAFEYNDYAHAIDGSAFRKACDNSKKESDDGKEETKVSCCKRPSNFLPAMQRFLFGTTSLVIHMVFSKYFRLSLSYGLDFMSASPVFRFAHAFFSLFITRMKYYFAWKVAEGASILAGFGFEGYDAEGKVIGWGGVSNVDPIAYESAANITLLSRAWNKRTQGWLERYTYQRTGKSLLATYFIVSVWHGFYPGFYVFFLTSSVIQKTERLIKLKINPLVVPGYDGFNDETYPKTVQAKIYWFICWFGTAVSMAYLAQVYVMRSLENCALALGSSSYFVHVIVILMYINLELMNSPKKVAKEIVSNETSTEK